MFSRGRAPTPTDLKLLDEIYNRYYEEFESFDQEGDPDRDAKIYVPVDLEEVADALGVEKDIVFGRLYYDLDRRYGYKHDDGTKVPFFSLKVGSDMHCVHFPYLASVVASLRAKKEKHLLATWISAFSLAIAVGSLLVSLLGSGAIG